MNRFWKCWCIKCIKRSERLGSQESWQWSEPWPPDLLLSLSLTLSWKCRGTPLAMSHLQKATSGKCICSIVLQFEKKLRLFSCRRTGKTEASRSQVAPAIVILSGNASANHIKSPSWWYVLNAHPWLRHRRASSKAGTQSPRRSPVNAPPFFHAKTQATQYQTNILTKRLSDVSKASIQTPASNCQYPVSLAYIYSKPAQDQLRTTKPYIVFLEPPILSCGPTGFVMKGWYAWSSTKTEVLWQSVTRLLHTYQEDLASRL